VIRKDSKRGARIVIRKEVCAGPPNEEPNDGDLSGSRADDRGSDVVRPAATPSPIDVAKIAADASMAAKERCIAILTDKEAEGRGTLAHHLALKTQVPVEEALAILSATPREKSGPAVRVLNSLDGRVPTFKIGSWAPDIHSVAASWEVIVARGNAEMAAAAGEQVIRTGDGRIIGAAARRAELAAGEFAGVGERDSSPTSDREPRDGLRSFVPSRGSSSNFF